MKKLMTVLASAATALFAIGVAKGVDFTTQGTGFEDYSEGAVFDAQKDDAGGTSGDKYWYSTASAGEIGEISNHVSTVAAALVPDYFKGDSVNNRYLKIDASDPLFRSAVANDQSGAFTGVDIGDGIYLDTLVQFTAADEAFQTDLDSGDKIAISYVEHEDDATTTDVNEGWTNFVIRAGQIVQGVLVQNNYFAAVPEGFKKEDWHRLTVRSIKLSETQAAFIIYLDGDQTKALAYPTSVNAGFDALTGVAADYYNENLHALYPSAVGVGDNITTISAASFSGTGALDDVVFTATKPSFITESVAATFIADAGVTAISVQVGEADPIAVDMTASPLVAVLPAGTTKFTVTATVDTENGYVFESMACGETTYVNGGTITGYAGTDITLTTKRDNAYYMDGETKVGFKTLAAAFTGAPAGAVIRLGYDYVVADNETVSDSQPVYAINKSLTLDLNGKTLNGGSSNARFMFSVALGTTFTVIDSVEGDAGKLVYGGTWGIFGGDGDVNIGNASDFGPVVDGAVIGDQGYVAEIVRGKFLAADNTTANNEFVCDTEDTAAGISVLGKDSTATLVGAYWVVSTGDTPQPTTYDVTYTKPEHAEVVTDPATITGLAAGATVAFTVTPVQGYEYAKAPEGWTLDNGAIKMTYTVVAGTNEVTIPAPEVVTPTTFALTTTGGANAVVTTDPADVTALTKPTEVTITAKPETDYTYTGVTLSDGWTLNAETGAISKELTVTENTVVAVPDAVSAGGKTYPSYIGDDTAKGKYDSWATYAGISDADFPDAQGTSKDAYLLNCKPSEVADAKAAFKFTSISYDAEQSKWVTTTTTSYNERAYNGTVEVKRYSDVGCTTLSETGSFFKAELK